ncbi:MAG TPA: DUF2834 domain-containing protein [Fontimonas sp.]
MNLASFKFLLVVLGAGFAVAFAVMVVPPLLASGDVVGAFAAGFVNPYSSGYALDAIMCWCVLAIWVLYERSTLGLRHGWVALLLGVVPGVATGFAFYLLLRTRQLGASKA